MGDAIDVRRLVDRSVIRADQALRVVVAENEEDVRPGWVGAASSLRAGVSKRRPNAEHCVRVVPLNNEKARGMVIGSFIRGSLAVVLLEIMIW